MSKPTVEDMGWARTMKEGMKRTLKQAKEEMKQLQPDAKELKKMLQEMVEEAEEAMDRAKKLAAQIDEAIEAVMLSKEGDKCIAETVLHEATSAMHVVRRVAEMMGKMVGDVWWMKHPWLH